MARYDEETALFEPHSSFTEEAVRKGFIKKVYAILIAMLALTFSVTIAFTTVPVLRDWGQTKIAFIVMIVLWVAALILMIVLMCSETLRRTHPHNMVFLSVLTVLFAVALGITASYSSPLTVLVVIGTTLLIVIALTAFAFQTKFDFTIFTGVLFCLTISLLVFGLLLLFFKSKLLLLVYATLGAFLMSCYIVVDTQMMMGGKHVQLDPEEYVFAALNLYVDIIMLFVYILAICTGLGGIN